MSHFVFFFDDMLPLLTSRESQRVQTGTLALVKDKHVGLVTKALKGNKSSFSPIRHTVKCLLEAPLL